MRKLKIKSDGTAGGTHVYVVDGIGVEHELTHVTRLEIEPIHPGEHVRARVFFERVELDLEGVAEDGE